MTLSLSLSLSLSLIYKVQALIILFSEDSSSYSVQLHSDPQSKMAPWLGVYLLDFELRSFNVSGFWVKKTVTFSVDVLKHEMKPLDNIFS